MNTVNNLTKEYNKLIKYQREKLDCFKITTILTNKEKSYEKIVNDILENIKLYSYPSVLELVQKHYVENKKIISLEGNLLRLAMNQNISETNLLNFTLVMKLILILKNF